MEYLIAEAVKLDYASIGRNILGIYLVLLLAFSGMAALGYTIKYNRSRKKLAKYYRMLKRLRIIYREEKGPLVLQDSEEDEVSGEEFDED